MGRQAFLDWIFSAIAVVACALALVMAILESGHGDGLRRWRRRLIAGWSDLDRAGWRDAPARALSFACERMDDLVRGGFATADRSTTFTFLFVGLVFIAIPAAAVINALTGGRPLLVIYYASLLAALVVLNFTAEVRRLSLLNRLIALYVGVSLLVVVPIYVLHSFTDVTIKYVFSHAALNSILVATLWYLAAYSVMVVHELGLRGLGVDVARSVYAANVRVFLAGLPVFYVLTFMVLLLGHVRELEAPPDRSWPLVMSSVVCSSLSLTAALAIARAACRARGAIAIVIAIVLTFAVSAATSVGLVYGAHLFSDRPLTVAAAAARLADLVPGRTSRVPGYDFWIMHVPFLPAIAMAVVVAAGPVAKAAATPHRWMFGGEGLARRPFLAGAFACVGVGCLAAVLASGV